MKDKKFLTQLALGTFDPYLLNNIIKNSKKLSILTAAKYFASGYDEMYEYGYETVSSNMAVHYFTQNEFMSVKLKRYVIIVHLIRQIKYEHPDSIKYQQKLRKLQNKLNKLHSQLFKD